MKYFNIQFALVKILIVVLFTPLVAKGEITRTVDSFNGNIFIRSALYNFAADGIYPHSATLYSTRQSIVGDFDGVTLVKYKLASGTTGYELHLYRDYKSPYTRYFGYDSTGTLKINGRFVNLSAFAFDSIESIAFNATPIISLLDQAVTMSLRVTGSKGTFDLNTSDSMIQEWKRLADINIDDSLLSAAYPIGNASVYNNSIVGWVSDPKDRNHKPQIHVYRGGKLVTALTADSERCDIEIGNTTTNICDGIPDEITKTWRPWLFKIDLSSLPDTSSEPLIIYAINSNANGANPKIFSGKVFTRSDIECVFNWAEAVLSDTLLERSTTHDEGAYKVRRYSNGSLLGATVGAGIVTYKLGTAPQENGGTLDIYLPNAIAANCGG